MCHKGVELGDQFQWKMKRSLREEFGPVLKDAPHLIKHDLISGRH